MPQTKTSTLIEAVNSIIKKSFGRGFKGNYKILGARLLNDSGEGKLGEINRLYIIGRKRFFGLYNEPVGLLGGRNTGNNDGSTIVIFPKYENRAKTYAQLYEQQFGKKVKILTEEIIDLLEFDYYEKKQALG